MPLKDAEWKTAYTAIATKLSATPGSSDGTAVEIETKNAVAVEFRLGAVSFVAATKIYIGLKTGDASSTTKWKNVNRRNGSRVKWPVASVGDGTEPFPTRSHILKVDPWLDATDNDATCTIQYRRIYPNRI